MLTILIKDMPIFKNSIDKQLEALSRALFFPGRENEWNYIFILHSLFAFCELAPASCIHLEAKTEAYL